MTSTLKEEIDEPYPLSCPRSLHGAVAKEGTDLAHHVLLSCLDYASMSCQSVFVLFVDLTKAFDKVLSKLVFGWPSFVQCDRESKQAYLESRGCSSSVAQWICEYIEAHGTAFGQMGINPKAASLVRELHTKSWSQYQGCDTFVYTKTGGRQGCKLGGVVFNNAYALALIALQELLKAEGVTASIRRKTGPFWATDAPTEDADEDVRRPPCGVTRRGR